MAGRTASRTSVQASSRSNKRRDDVALSIVDARRIALAAQGFGREHRGATDLARLSSVIDRVGVLQIDSVNVLVRSQELPIFARIGDHDRSVVAKAVTRGKMFEYWVHEASLAPVELHPLMRWRMARPHPWAGPSSTPGSSWPRLART